MLKGLNQMSFANQTPKTNTATVTIISDMVRLFRIYFKVNNCKPNVVSLRNDEG